MKILKIFLFTSFAISFATAKADDTYFSVYFTNGTVKIFPMEYVENVDTINDATLHITIKNTDAYNYLLTDIDSVSYQAVLPERPLFTSFGFKKKLNEQITESITDELPTSLMEFQIGGIGKWLTPSFSLNNPKGKVYVNGVEQVSKRNRLRFNGDVVYNASCEGFEILNYKQTSPEVWTEEVRGVPKREIALTAAMLSTNAPSNVGDDLAYMLDDNANTIFHSTWGTGSYEKLPLDSCPYIDVALPEPVKNFQFYTKTRNVASYNPLAWRIYASHDGKNWTIVKEITTTDGLPQVTAGAEYTSMTIIVDESYEYLRFEETKAEHRNYIALAEFRLYAVDNDGSEIVLKPATLVTPAAYEYKMEPYGSEYTVRVNWLTDQTNNVPTISINVDGGQSITSKYDYLHAQIKIDGGGVFENMVDSVWVKGRGNSSWNFAKKPYRLKFDSKVKPFGLTKGKSWVLLANAQTGSMMSNAIGMKVARMVGSAGANHMIPVELYINGSYVGSYCFTEKVGLSNNSIDIDGLNSVLLELDEYYDEAYKFKSSTYTLPVNVSEPDLSEEPFVNNASLYITDFTNDFNVYAKAVSSGLYKSYIDVDALCRYLFVNDLILNYEITHPKSTFLYKQHTDYTDSKYVYGPVWDLDWGFGYENSYNYYKSSSTNSIFEKGWPASTFFKRMLTYNTTIAKYYHKVCADFVTNHMNELLDYAQDYYDYANPSFIHNNTVWGDGSSYGSSINDIRTWFTSRAAYVLSQYSKYDYSEFEQNLTGDVNGDDILSVGDIVTLMNYINGDEKAEFLFDEADVDGDGVVTANDKCSVVDSVAAYTSTVYPAWRWPFSDTSIHIGSFDAQIGGDPVEATVAINASEGTDNVYAAIQFDLSLPVGLTLEDIKVVGTDHHVKMNKLSDGTVRVMVYSDNNSPIVSGQTLFNLVLKANDVIADTKCIINLTNCIIALNSGDEERIQSVSSDFSLSSGINSVYADYKVEGGSQLSVDAIKPTDVDIYTVGGILARSIKVNEGHTEIQLDNGIYIVNRQKVEIKR